MHGEQQGQALPSHSQHSHGSRKRKRRVRLTISGVNEVSIDFKEPEASAERGQPRDSQARELREEEEEEAEHEGIRRRADCAEHELPGLIDSGGHRSGAGNDKKRIFAIRFNGVENQHGPSMSDHMEEKMRYKGYFDMRNQKLRENQHSSIGSTTFHLTTKQHKMGKVGVEGSHASIYRKLCKEKICNEEKKEVNPKNAPHDRESQAGAGAGAGAGESNKVYEAPPIFAGVVAYLDGRTGRYSALHLTKLVQLHGKVQTSLAYQRVEQDCTTGGECNISLGKRTVTHVICENLCGDESETLTC
ncbi:hypothetical protein GUITHDRAFT_165129 [Guillardia theta CCMP2712]|uniref:BRCT domain-containing protein n=1 Tax=Guillardia theta (strain CCMP2712) TaxID=905079 RepID=L1IRF9_GUITC|nr:hypothetical protein GUITHDRAFT_165129 [Guillardia theta CCMP2712]EKX38813.1 hypothetical protein GUITHDRAFT_165129 [Guillardia theta CCMP2712]|eukprot:XP_005825793.1 hypothetical protein GUITHDRAFT_165129 [Guillardia theta CCMP2712]